MDHPLLALPDWRSASDYCALSTLDRAGLAFEFLRRNPDFRALVATGSPPRWRAGDVPGPEPLPWFDPGLASWGLDFRGRPAS